MDQHILDWDKCLASAGGNEGVARELIQLLINMIPELKSTMQMALMQNDVITLQKAIHKFHGAAAYCGAEEARTLAATIETQCMQQHNAQAFSLLPEFLEALETLECVCDQVRG